MADVEMILCRVVSIVNQDTEKSCCASLWNTQCIYIHLIQPSRFDNCTCKSDHNLGFILVFWIIQPYLVEAKM